MTKKAAYRTFLHSFLSLLAVSLSLCSVLFLSQDASRGALKGLVLCAGTVIPSVFPYMVLGDFVSSFLLSNGLGIIELVFSLPLKLSQTGGAIGLSGLLCGFPTAARISAEEYRRGSITKNEAIRTAALFSNPSPSFIIGAVGAGLFSSKRLGALLFISLLLSIYTVGILYRSGALKEDKGSPSLKHCFNFISSVRSAATASVTVFAFITFFRAGIEVLSALIGRGAIFSSLLPFIEISSAAEWLSCSSITPLFLYLSLGFSVGFGGICANFQCAAFLSDAGLPVRNFFALKLLLGAVCSIFSTLFLGLLPLI